MTDNDSAAAPIGDYVKLTQEKARPTTVIDDARYAIFAAVSRYSKRDADAILSAKVQFVKFILTKKLVMKTVKKIRGSPAEARVHSMMCVCKSNLFYVS